MMGGVAPAVPGGPCVLVEHGFLLGREHGVKGFQGGQMAFLERDARFRQGQPFSIFSGADKCANAARSSGGAAAGAMAAT